MKGKLITLIGVDSVLKGTNMELILETLKKKGYKAHLIKYPMYDCLPTGPRIRAYLRENNPDNLRPDEFQNLCAQNRRDWEVNLISLLEQNEFVLADLYVESALVYGYTEGLSLTLVNLQNQGLVNSDLVLVCDGEPVTRSDEKPHYFEGTQKTELIRKAHLGLAKHFGWKVIDQEHFLRELEEWVGTISKSGRA